MDQHSIYTNQTILEIFGGLFKDSKVFVDSCLVVEPAQFHAILLQEYYQRNGSSDDSNTTLHELYNKYFKPPHESYAPHALSIVDYGSQDEQSMVEPALPAASSPFHDWSKFLFKVYRLLLRHPKLVSDGERRCITDSLIKTEYPYVVPGGRFTEAYYWDTFWMLKGLVLPHRAGLDQLLVGDQVRRGILLNMKQFVLQHGFVPNGNRIYYLNRSQPPLLTLMVVDEMKRLQFDQAIQLLREMIEALDKEYQWWMNYRSHNMSGTYDSDKVNVNVYNVSNYDPRPESYKEDLHLWKQINSTGIRSSSSLYSSIASVAESGWDFSSRWFDSTMYDKLDIKLASSNPQSVVPIDLNSIMLANERFLARFHLLLECFELQLPGEQCQKIYDQFIVDNLHRGQALDSAVEQYQYSNKTGSQIQETDTSRKWNKFRSYYSQQLRQRSRYINENMFNSQTGEFFDLDLNTGSQKMSPYSQYLSVFYPLWLQVYNQSDTAQVDLIEKSVERALQDYLKYPGGIPSSLVQSGEQWDLPNAWPPLVWILTEGLLNLPPSSSASSVVSNNNNSTTGRANHLAQKYVPLIVQQWINTTYCGWRLANPRKHVPTHDEYVQTLVKRDLGLLSSPSSGQSQHSNISKGNSSNAQPSSSYSSMPGMYEKYDVTRIGVPGIGGEYVVQDGFGWTNGVVLDYLRRFSKWENRNHTLPGWFSYDNELEMLQWQDGLQLPSDSFCGVKSASNNNTSLKDTGVTSGGGSNPVALQIILSFVLVASVAAAIIAVVVNRNRWRKSQQYQQIEEYEFSTKP
ncbi:hypothetical protein MP228_011759 [Amoeboaphelidium protococcarum]|nr:hypothetical protein MP228_011759 [Amoeboaphelidium protococcarum]